MKNNKLIKTIYIDNRKTTLQLSRVMWSIIDKLCDKVQYNKHILLSQLYIKFKADPNYITFTAYVEDVVLKIMYYNTNKKFLLNHELLDIKEKQ